MLSDAEGVRHSRLFSYFAYVSQSPFSIFLKAEECHLHAVRFQYALKSSVSVALHIKIKTLKAIN